MPDFDTRTPQEERNRPLRLRIALIANKLRTLLTANKVRIPLIANRVRGLLNASKGNLVLLAERLRSLLVVRRLRTLLIGGGILLFVVAAIPVGLLISCSSRMSDQQHKRGVVSHIHGGPVSNGKIVFLRYGDGHNNDLYVMNADGSGETHLTDDGLELVRLSWSPDGKKIAFIRSDVAGFSDIYVINADGTGETKLTTTLEELDVHVGTPLWSPDGKKIAFERNAEKVTDTDTSVPASAPVEEMSGIYVMNADGTDLHKLPNTSGSSYSPAWSPDGKKIAFTEISGHYDDIYVMNADGTGQTNLTNSPHTNEGRPAWSPDGEKIAFEVGGGTGSDIYVMNSDGTGRTRLTDTGE